MDTPDLLSPPPPPVPDQPDPEAAPDGPIWFLLGIFTGMFLMCLIRAI